MWCGCKLPLLISSSEFLHRNFFIGIFSSDYAELTEHTCSTDYARNLNGFGLAAIGLARNLALAHNHCSSPVAISLLVQALGGIATTVRSSFRLKSVRNPRKAVKVPIHPRNPMKKNNKEKQWRKTMKTMKWRKWNRVCHKSMTHPISSYYILKILLSSWSCG